MPYTMQLCWIQLLYATKLHRVWLEVSCCMVHETCCLELDQWSKACHTRCNFVACNSAAWLDHWSNSRQHVSCNMQQEISHHTRCNFVACNSCIQQSCIVYGMLNVVTCTVHLTCAQDELNPNIPHSRTVLHQQYLTACLPVWVPHLCPAHWVFPVGVWKATQYQERAGYELCIALISKLVF